MENNESLVRTGIHLVMECINAGKIRDKLLMDLSHVAWSGVA